MIYRVINIFSIALIGVTFVGSSPAVSAVNDVMCGSLQTAFGPYDYRSDKATLPVVELHHFTPEVENLRSGNHRHPGSTVGGDLNYTLHAYPNHHRALMAMIRYGERQKSEKPPYASHTVECFLYRAWRFRPDDGMVRLIYASYLAKRGRSSEALNHLNTAVSLGLDTPNAYYNIGLIYFEIKEYKMALSYAHKAYKMGYSLPGLREKLKKAGKWEELPVDNVETLEADKDQNN